MCMLFIVLSVLLAPSGALIPNKVHIIIWVTAMSTIQCFAPLGDPVSTVFLSLLYGFAMIHMKCSRQLWKEIASFLTENHFSL